MVFPSWKDGIVKWAGPAFLWLFLGVQGLGNLAVLARPMRAAHHVVGLKRLKNFIISITCRNLVFKVMFLI